MRKLIYEEPVVPVIIDREQELQAYYSCVNDLVKEPISPQYTSYPPVPPQAQWQPPPDPYGYPQQGYGYPPQPAQVGYPPQQPYPMQTQPQYPAGYPPNPAYPTYPPNPGYYPPAQPNQYAPQPGYPAYEQYPQAPPAQPAWGGYSQPYGAYGQAPQPTPAYQPYYGGQSTPQPGQDYVTQQHQSTEQSLQGEVTSSASAPPDDNYSSQNKPMSFGWNDMLFSDAFNSSYPSPPPPSSSSYYSGMRPVEETVSISQASTGHVNDHYMKQFERLNIGWNL